VGLVLTVIVGCGVLELREVTKALGKIEVGALMALAGVAMEVGKIGNDVSAMKPYSDDLRRIADALEEDEKACPACGRQP